MRSPSLFAAALCASLFFLPQAAFCKGKDSCEKYYEQYQKYEERLQEGKGNSEDTLKKLNEVKEKLTKAGCQLPQTERRRPGRQCQRDPGMCLRCLRGRVVPDNNEDPGMCKRCQGGFIVADNSENPGTCYRCEQGSIVYDNGITCEDGDPCTRGSKCSNGACKSVYTCPASPSTPCDMKYCTSRN